MMSWRCADVGATLRTAMAVRSDLRPMSIPKTYLPAEGGWSVNFRRSRSKRVVEAPSQLHSYSIANFSGSGHRDLSDSTLT